MAEKKSPKDGETGIRHKKDRAAEVANTFEWLITAFILAFVFRAFVMEAFRIPTGSMADTLKGAHFRLRCRQCGFKYEYGYMPGVYDNQPADTIPPGEVRLPSTRCPSCGYYPDRGRFHSAMMPVANGDRILVLKCLYQFFEPYRWDVIVFKNPSNPSENYIKRLIGLPGEQVEIIDGDIYINGVIARKPARVQRELWMPVYNHDFQPVQPDERAFNGHAWDAPFDFANSAWKVEDDTPTEILLDSPPDEQHVLRYTAPSANDFTTTYAYNRVSDYDGLPECSDLMVRFYVLAEGSRGTIGATLSKYGVDYKAWVDLGGQVYIGRKYEGQETILCSEEIEPPNAKRLTSFKFANVDHELHFEFGKRRLSVDLGREPDALRGTNGRAARAEIFGGGKLKLSHVALFRDIHYMRTQPGSSVPGRATEGRPPFKLEKDEFFVLGDNSPNSEDCRWWSEPTDASKGSNPPRAGVVPRNYLVGKALFVYWPSGFGFPWPEWLRTSAARSAYRSRLGWTLNAIVSLRWIPNVGQMRFIYGGCKGPEVESAGSERSGTGAF